MMIIFLSNYNNTYKILRAYNVKYNYYKWKKTRLCLTTTKCLTKVLT